MKREVRGQGLGETGYGNFHKKQVEIPSRASIFFFHERRWSFDEPEGNRGSWRDLRKNLVHFKKAGSWWWRFHTLVSFEMKSSEYVRGLCPFFEGVLR